MDSHIAYGAPHKQDTSAAHGEPLGEEEIRLTKRNYGWPEDAKFLVPDGVYERFKERLGQRGRGARDAWMAKFAEYGKQFPELAGYLDKIQKRELPEGWDADVPVFPADPKGMAGRDASGKVENAIAKSIALADRRRGRSGAFHEDAAHFRGRGRSGSRRTTAGATCISASASMPWDRF